MNFLLRWFGRRTTGVATSAAGLERRIGSRFKNPGLLQQALTHRSSLPDLGTGSVSNERMEFLGDAVLGVLVSEHLYRAHPGLQEGELTKMKSLLVSKTILAQQAREMGLGRYLRLSDAEAESGGRDRTSILGDAFEAVLGALYLDQGLESARRFVQRQLLEHAGDITSDMRHVNDKSLLQEHVQGRFKAHLQYRTRAEEGPEHEKWFTMEVAASGQVLGSGRGRNKKEAEQHAACDALIRLGVLKPEDIV
ncbi:MAG: ribonuclease III [Candidatus Eisenbacteria bacterium]|nr:ribonuclease III [Candidatus Eisenbacteria bacterium]